MRVISFTDRFGVERHIGFLTPQKESDCRNAYGEHWPKIKAYLAGLVLIQEKYLESRRAPPQARPTR